MKRSEEFLNKYKTLEKTVSLIPDLRDGFVRIYAYENSEYCMDPDKLKLCRIVRNYMQHNADYEKFVSISEGMVRYLEKENNHALMSICKVSDKMKHTKAVKLNDRILENAKRLSKITFVPLIDENKKVVGIFSDETLRNAIISNIDKESTFSSMLNLFTIKNIPLTYPDVPMTDIKTDSVVIDRKTGKYCGIVKIEDGR